MHGSVFLDADGRVIRPALLWNDQRTAAECAEIEQRAGGREALIRMVANPALTGFTAPKILWVRNHEPRPGTASGRCSCPRTTSATASPGTYATEVSDASGTLLLDVANRRWSTELLGKLDLDPALLPDCFESPEVSSTVSALGAAATGLAAGTPIVGGGGDQPAGAVGNGIVRAGVVSATMGTSGVVFAHTAEPGFDPLGRLQRGCHAVPGAWHVMGVVLSAGGSFQWFRNELGKAEVDRAKAQGRRPLFPADRRGGDRRPRRRGAVLPALPDRRAHPALRPRRQGGLGRPDRPPRPRAHDPERPRRGDLRDARQPGTDPRDGRLDLPDPPLRRRRRNPLWRQIQADVYGNDVHTLNSTEGPAFGVALLAQVGTGGFSSVPEACDATIRLADQTAVDPKARRFYDRGYEIYRQLYKDLRASFAAISGGRRIAR